MFGGGSKFETGSKGVNKELQAMTEKSVEENDNKKIAKAGKASVENKEAMESRRFSMLEKKTQDAIFFLNDLPAWKKRFGELTPKTEISKETLDMLNTWMSNPDNRYENGKWISGSVEQAQEKRAKVQMSLEQAKADFAEKYESKIKTWVKKGYEAEMDNLVKAYMKNPGLDLVVDEKEKKVAWGKPEAGFNFNQ